MRRLGIVALFLFSSPLAAQAADDWPGFRGGARAGVGAGKTLPSTWDNTTNVLWQAATPGRGWSSPVVCGGRVYVTSVVSATKPPEPRKGLYIRDVSGKPVPGEHRWLVHCLDAATGKLLWQREAHKGKAPGPVHLKNTYASETPVADAGHV